MMVGYHTGKKHSMKIKTYKRKKYIRVDCPFSSQTITVSVFISIVDIGEMI